MKRLLFGIILSLSLISIFMATFNIQVVKAWTGTVYIRDDGSIDPLNAPIERFGDIYTLTDNIISNGDGIIVERDNIVIDGDFHTLQGSGGKCGINLTYRGNVTIRNMVIKDFDEGIRLCNAANNHITWINITSCNWYAIFAIWSDNNCISKCILSDNEWGIWLKGDSNNNTIKENVVEKSMYSGIGLSGVSNNYIYKNTIINNSYGIWIKLFSSNNFIYENNIITNHIYNIWFRESSDNRIYKNNFISEKQQVFSETSTNIWDHGYPSGGNYWSNYTGVDANGDGIGDTPHYIDENNTDPYPLMAPITVFEAGVWNGTSYDISIVSNSRIINFCFNPSNVLIEFNVASEKETCFCRVTVPKSLLWAEENNWTILVDSEILANYTIITDENNTYLYFSYTHITSHISIQGTNAIPEFRQTALLTILIIETLLTAKIWQKRRKYSTFI